jgi:hypothetical protein
MMKMLQKILSHGLLIAVIVAAFFLYTNRAELLPNWFGKAGSETAQTDGVNQSATVQATDPVAATQETKSTGTADLNAETTTSVPVTPETALATPVPGAVGTYRPLEPAEQGVAASDTRSAQVPETPVYRPQEDEAVDTNAVAAGETGMGVGETPDESTRPEEQVAGSEVVDQQPAPVEQPAAPETTAVVAPGTASNKSEGKTVQQQLEEARQLYWQKDVTGATEVYEALGRDYPGDADIWGEIGNFYYSVQQSESAGTAYYRTVSLLIDKGDTQKARQLLGVLYELDANRGRELDARLQQSVE